VVNVSVSGDLTSFHFANAQVGWAGGRLGMVFRSADRGRTWQKVDLPVAADVVRVRLTSANRGIALMSNGYAFLTDDGGETWQHQVISNQGHIFDLDYDGSRYIVTTRYHVYTTPEIRLIFPGVMEALPGDGSGTAAPAGPRFVRLGSLRFGGEGEELTASYFHTDGVHAWLGGMKDGTPRTIKSTDGGDSWLVDGPRPGMSRVNDIHFLNVNEGLMCCEGRERILRTEDGHNFRAEERSDGWREGETVHRVFNATPTRAYATGARDGRGYLLVRGRRGQWTPTEQAFSRPEPALFALGSDCVWAGENPDDAVRSTGGLRFEDMDFRVSGWIHDFYFINRERGWCGVYNGILHTENGGATWELQGRPHSDADVVGLCFADADEGMAVYGNGVVVWTEDGGDTWNVVLDKAAASASGIQRGINIARFRDHWFMTADNGIYTTMPRPLRWVGPLRRVNHAPVLRWSSARGFDDGVEPEPALQGRLAEFRVCYSDPDGDPPQDVRVRVTDPNGLELNVTLKPWTMGAGAQEFRRGVDYGGGYVPNRSGTHRYYFWARDQARTNATGPPTRHRDWPVVPLEE
jgi:photosystem II stability/assembly factor-like uncharacterized protein